MVGTTVNSAPGGASDLFREMDVNQQSYTCKPWQVPLRKGRNSKAMKEYSKRTWPTRRAVLGWLLHEVPSKWRSRLWARVQRGGWRACVKAPRQEGTWPFPRTDESLWGWACRQWQGEKFESEEAAQARPCRALGAYLNSNGGQLKVVTGGCDQSGARPLSCGNGPKWASVDLGRQVRGLLMGLGREVTL